MLTRALRHDEGKIDYTHIVPIVWIELLRDTPNNYLIVLNDYMDQWYYYGRPFNLKLQGFQRLHKETSPVLEFGAIKYEKLNYAKGMLYSRVMKSFRRHIYAHIAGEEVDAESGLPHVQHAACNLLFAYTYERLGYNDGDLDDRPLGVLSAV